jgi:hypothetical protein
MRGQQSLDVDGGVFGPVWNHREPVRGAVLGSSYRQALNVVLGHGLEPDVCAHEGGNNEHGGHG